MLASHPTVLEAVLKDQPDTDDLDMETLSRMNVLDHALAEAERLFPPIPHLPRGITEDIEFKDHTLRRGEFLFCSVAGTHHDPSIFADPEKFDPARFAPPRSERRGQPLALAGFNVGPRRCLGALLGQVMIKVMVHHIVRNFVLEPEPQAHAPSISFPMLYPSNAMPFRVKARA
jgi:cytochrome P450